MGTKQLRAWTYKGFNVYPWQIHADAGVKIAIEEVDAGRVWRICLAGHVRSASTKAEAMRIIDEYI